MTATVHQAAPEDLFAIEQTLLKAAELADFPVPSVERPYVYNKLLQLIDHRLVWVAVGESRVVGCLILEHAYWHWNSKVWFLTNPHFWVEPKYRKGGTAAKLLQCAKQCAVELKVPLYLELSFGGLDSHLKDRFVRMQGLAYKGGRFCFDPAEARREQPSSLLGSSLRAANE